ncbi:MAG: iron-containing alcohol dehydrogenase, partial [Candidatus Methylacidiphilales bacterium]
MLNFEFKNPTKIHFGKGLIEKVATEIPANAKVLMLYGGGSIMKNGIYEQVKSALKNFEVVEFGGIPANPEYAVLLKALEIIKTQNITY